MSLKDRTIRRVQRTDNDVILLSVYVESLNDDVVDIKDRRHYNKMGDNQPS